MNRMLTETRTRMILILLLTIGTGWLCGCAQAPWGKGAVGQDRPRQSGPAPSDGFLGYRAVGVRADNDTSCPTTAMRMSAESLVVFNPADASSRLITAPTANLRCAIETFGPVGESNFRTHPEAGNAFGPGARDQLTSFVVGANVWFYWIWGKETGLNTICSLRAPTLGPNLPAGYTHYAPAFPVVLGTAQPSGPELLHDAALTWPVSAGGWSRLRVRGNKAFYLATPVWMLTTGEYVTAIDLSPVVPRDALTAILYLDAELISSDAGPVWAGLVPHVGLPETGNYTHFSVYSPAAKQAAPQDCSLEFPLEDSRIMSVQWLRINGPRPITYIFCVFTQGYTFSN